MDRDIVRALHWLGLGIAIWGGFVIAALGFGFSAILRETEIDRRVGRRQT